MSIDLIKDANNDPLNISSKSKNNISNHSYKEGAEINNIKGGSKKKAG